MQNVDYNIALVVPFALAYVGVKVHKWWQARHSPADGPTPIGGVKPQVGAGVTPNDPTSEGATGEGKAILRTKPSVDSWLAEHAPGGRTNQLIREGVRHLGVSASTMKRRLRKLREDNVR